MLTSLRRILITATNQMVVKIKTRRNVVKLDNLSVETSNAKTHPVSVSVKILRVERDAKIRLAKDVGARILPARKSALTLILRN